MTGRSAEENFYKASNNWDVKSLGERTPAALSLGGRYRICYEGLNANSRIDKNLIVEIGCGSGECLMYLKSRYGFRSAEGVDLSYGDEMLVDGVRFYSENLNKSWGFADGSVDCLISMMLFEHLFDPWFCFSEVKRILSPDGRAFVNLPIVTNFKNRLRLALGRLPETSVPYARWRSEGHWDGFHLHYFSCDSIEDLASASGLKIVSRSGVGRMTWLKNIFPSLLCGELSFELAHAT